MPEAPRQTAAAPASSRPVARWAVAVIAVVYGFAKLNGAQFTVLDSELDKPMGSVSGFWLVWYFFGYSSVYGNLIALVQIAGGLLVTQARFALAGALLLLPVAVNIVLVDIFYGIDLGGTLAAVVFLGLVVAIVKPHARRLFDAVVPPAGGEAGTRGARTRRRSCSSPPRSARRTGSRITTTGRRPPWMGCGTWRPWPGAWSGCSSSATVRTWSC